MADRLPGYRLHKPSGQAYVRLSGRMYYLGKFRSKASREEYNRLVSEWLASGRSPSFSAAPSELTVVEMASGYLKWAKGYYIKN